MKAETVIEFLQLLQDLGVDAWVDGGWGVDALLGRQTRAHEDLDLVVALVHVPRICEVLLGARRFALSEDQLPVRFVLTHPQVGQIDFHTVTFDDRGGGLQPQPNGAVFRYPPEGFVCGRIAGQVVRCISAEVQVLCHLGYEPTEKDAHDVLSLHHALGAELPASYRRFLTHRAVSSRHQGMGAIVLTKEFAARFATEWIAAWNNHDLPSILSHYSEDFEMSSPVIAQIADEPSGKLSGKKAIGAYWSKALQRIPNLHFELVTTLVGVDSITLYYEGPRGKSAEVFHFGPEGKVVKAFAHYA